MGNFNTNTGRELRTHHSSRIIRPRPHIDEAPEADEPEIYEDPQTGDLLDKDAMDALVIDITSKFEALLVAEAAPALGSIATGLQPLADPEDYDPSERFRLPGHGTLE